MGPSSGSKGADWCDRCVSFFAPVEPTKRREESVEFVKRVRRVQQLRRNGNEAKTVFNLQAADEFTVANISDWLIKREKEGNFQKNALEKNRTEGPTKSFGSCRTGSEGQPKKVLSGIRSRKQG